MRTTSHLQSSLQYISQAFPYKGSWYWFSPLHSKNSNSVPLFNCYIFKWLLSFNLPWKTSEFHGWWLTEHSLLLFTPKIFFWPRAGYGGSKSMWSNRWKDVEFCVGTSSSLVPDSSPGSGSDIMVSDCRSKEQMSDCSYTRPSPVFGFWIFSQCCFRNFCNNPQNRVH
jgi:hypothetical protein